MTQRRVTLAVDDKLAWLLPVPESLPAHTRPATVEALGELAARYLPDPVDPAWGTLTCRVAGIVAGLIAERELRGPWGD
jgi:hypothetical protein